MAYGPNRAAPQSRASFQTAGGCLIKFRHPFLAGALDLDSTGGAIDEIDVSRSLKLAATFFSAIPNQDSSSQMVTVSGDTVVITNHMLNGTITIPVLRTTGKVSTGDFVAALQLIVASKDSVGGTIEKTKFINGEAHTRLFYGVSVKTVPHDIEMGLEVPEFSCQLYYAGFIDSISASGDANMKAIWAVGSETGIQGIYKPYDVNLRGSTLSSPRSLANVTGHGNVADDLSAAANANTTDNPLEAVAGYPNLSNAVQPFPA